MALEVSAWMNTNVRQSQSALPNKFAEWLYVTTIWCWERLREMERSWTYITAFTELISWYMYVKCQVFGLGAAKIATKRRLYNCCIRACIYSASTYMDGMSCCNPTWSCHADCCMKLSAESSHRWTENKHLSRDRLWGWFAGKIPDYWLRIAVGIWGFGRLHLACICIKLEACCMYGVISGA